MMNIKRSAFTLIELIFVIVILGIIGGVVLEAIRNYYEGIYRTSEYTKRVAQADHILQQVSKYFENAISLSIVNLDVNNTTGNCKIPEATDDGSDYTVAFVAVDSDSLRGGWHATASRYVPGWNEDVNISGVNTLTQSGADYTLASAIGTALNGIDLTGFAIYNSSRNAPNNGGCFDYRLDNTATDINNTRYLTISAFNASTASVNRPLSDDNAKRAYLLRSAYAFRVANDANGSFYMYSDFRPWAGTRYDANGVKKSLLGRNVAHFYADYNATDFMLNDGVTDRGLVWRLKVCMRGIDQNLSASTASANDICREKRVHVRY